MKIGEKSRIYNQLLEDWRLPMALMRGTRGMRENASEYLPRWPQESDIGYKARVNSSNLYNAFRRTCRVLSGKPFGKPVTIQEASPAVVELEYDIDRKGMSITQFARRMLLDKLVFGLCHFLVDNPAFIGKMTLADQRNLNIHPYFVRLRPDSLIYWRTAQGFDGTDILEELHIESEMVDGDDEEWIIIKVWTRESITTYRKKKHSNDTEAFAQVTDLPNNLGYIPLVTSYADVSHAGFMQATSPLEDLAWLNLRHFQSQSDQDTSLHFARVPFLHFAGFQKSEVDTTISANNAYVSSNPSAKVVWVETTGASLEAGSKDLDQLENRMDVMGADLMIQKPGNETATAKAIDSAEKISDLQAMVMSLESALESGYEIAQDWMNVKFDDTDIQLDTSFGLSLKDAKELDFLLKSRIAGEISRELFYQEIQRRGVFEEFDDEEELNRVAIEERTDQSNVIA